MPYEVAIPLIDTALRALLVADGTVVALLSTKPTARGGGPAIYSDGDVPSGATFPYLTMGAWTQVGSHNLSPDGSPGSSGYGWNCTGQIKAVGQLGSGRSETTLLNLMSAVFAALPQGQGLTVSGYSSGWIDEFNLQPALKTTLAGVVTIEVPAIIRVYVHD
jgi:hypothetical protein